MIEDRDSVEQQLQAAIQAVFDSQGNTSAQLGQRIADAVYPILLETARESAALLVLLWMMEDDPASTPSMAIRLLGTSVDGPARRQADELGRGVEQTTEDILSSGGDPFSDSRAEMIAITETTHAVQAGELAAAAAWRANYKAKVAYWVTANDDRVCNICGPLDGQHQDVWIAVQPMGPPAHPRCRCRLDWRNN